MESPFPLILSCRLESGGDLRLDRMFLDPDAARVVDGVPDRTRHGMPEAENSTAEKAAASPDPQRTAVTESATAAVPVALPSASSTVSVSPAAESVAAPASTSTAGASRSGSAAAPISTAEDEFGIPVGQKPSRRDDPDEISATVTKVGVQAHGEHVVYLDNGHVWQENFKNRHFPVEPGSVVTIKKRRFGGYNLYNDTGSVFRVKRIR